MPGIYANLLDTLVNDGNEEMAVRLAVIYSDPTRFDTKIQPLATDRYNAACDVALGLQTVFPCCEFCHWPLIPGGEPHTDCDQQLADAEDVEWFEGELDDDPSIGTVRARARSVFGNTELAREAAAQYPGDFI
jgi:hypothetical protein